MATPTQNARSWGWLYTCTDDCISLPQTLMRIPPLYLDSAIWFNVLLVTIAGRLRIRPTWIVKLVHDHLFDGKSTFGFVKPYLGVLNRLSWYEPRCLVQHQCRSDGHFFVALVSTCFNPSNYHFSVSNPMGIIRRTFCVVIKTPHEKYPNIQLSPWIRFPLSEAAGSIGFDHFLHPRWSLDRWLDSANATVLLAAMWCGDVGMRNG